MIERPNPYSLRIDPTVMHKIKIIAAAYGRSVNKEIEYRLKEVVNDWEKEHGSIPVPNPDGEEK